MPLPVALAAALGIGGALIQGAGTIGGLLEGSTNLDLQKENLKYQKSLQNKIFGREDTAIQRRVTDLRAAGLSPILAAGNAGRSGAIVNTQAPQSNKIEKMLLGLKMSQELAQTRLLNAQAKGLDLQNQKNQETLQDQINVIKAQPDLTYQQQWKARLDNELLEYTRDTEKVNATIAKVKYTLLHDKHPMTVNGQQSFYYTTNKLAEDIASKQLNNIQIENAIKALTSTVLAAQASGAINDKNFYEQSGISPALANLIIQSIKLIQ